MLNEIILTEFQFARWWELWGLSLPFSPSSDHQESKWWHSSTRTHKDLTLLQHKLDERNWNITMSVSSKRSETFWLKTRFCLRLEAWGSVASTYSHDYHSHTHSGSGVYLDKCLQKDWIASRFHFGQLGCEVSFGFVVWNHDWKISPNTDIKL